MDISKFKNAFIEEALDYVTQIEQSLIHLENSKDSKHIETIFRAMHSLKGGGAMFEFNNVSTFTHQMESLYEKVQANVYPLSQSILDYTFKSIDLLKELLNNDDQCADMAYYNQLFNDVKIILTEGPKEEEQKEAIEETNIDANEVTTKSAKKIKTYYILFQPPEDIMSNGTNPLFLLDELVSYGESLLIPHTDKIPELSVLNPELCYIFWEIILASSASQDELQEVFLFVEDESNIIIKELSEENLLEDEAFKKQISELPKGQLIDTSALTFAEPKTVVASHEVDITAKEDAKAIETSSQNKPNASKEKNELQTIKVSTLKIDALMNIVSELVISDSILQDYAHKTGEDSIAKVSESIAKLTTELKDLAIKISMIPLSTVIVRFQRLIRDLAIEHNKKITLETKGESTQLDKNIIEHLIDPILHIIRNSVGHGLESEEERIKLGKNPEGKISIKAYYSGDKVVIEISDDGRGFNTEAIRKKAIEKGLIDKNDELSEKELTRLILLPGFSTSETVNDLSGRGVGMDVVNRSIQSIKGTVELSHEKNIGSTFKLIIPSTLSIIDGIQVKVESTNLIIPIVNVDWIDSVQVHKINKPNKIVALKDESVSCLPLFFDATQIKNENKKLPVIVIKPINGVRYGLVIHQVIDQSQIVIKPIGNYLASLPHFLGASVLGNGEIAYILDVNAISQNGMYQLNPIVS